VGTKIDEFEESTKIKSSHEINEMLRNAAARPEPIFNDEDSGGFGNDAHTQVGNIQDLIAKSKEVEPPPPVVPRASTHVIRRASSPVVIERPALGSQSDFPPPSDDDAFREYDAPAAGPDLAAPIAFDALESAGNEATIDEPQMLPSMPVGRPLPLPPPPTSMPMPVVRNFTQEQPRPTQLRWGAIAWVALLVVTMATATLSYLKISELQQDLADARAQLKTKR